MISVFDGYSLYLENINKLDMNQFWISRQQVLIALYRKIILHSKANMVLVSFCSNPSFLDIANEVSNACLATHRNALPHISASPPSALNILILSIPSLVVVIITMPSPPIPVCLSLFWWCKFTTHLHFHSWQNINLCFTRTEFLNFFRVC